MNKQDALIDKALREHRSEHISPWAVYAQTVWHNHDGDRISHMHWVNPTVYHWEQVPATYERISPRFSTETQATAYLPNIQQHSPTSRGDAPWEE